MSTEKHGHGHASTPHEDEEHEAGAAESKPAKAESKKTAPAKKPAPTEGTPGAPEEDEDDEEAAPVRAAPTSKPGKNMWTKVTDHPKVSGIIGTVGLAALLATSIVVSHSGKKVKHGDGHEGPRISAPQKTSSDDDNNDDEAVPSPRYGEEEPKVKSKKHKSNAEEKNQKSDKGEDGENTTAGETAIDHPLKNVTFIGKISKENGDNDEWTIQVNNTDVEGNGKKRHVEGKIENNEQEGRISILKIRFSIGDTVYKENDVRVIIDPKTRSGTFECVGKLLE